MAVVVLIVAAILLAACGGGNDEETPAEESPAAQATEPMAETEESPEAESTAETTPPESEATAEFNACELLTKEEAEAVLGASVDEPVPEATPPVYSCSYTTADLDSVDVIVVVFDDEDQAKDVYDLAIENNGYPEISGIGDRAYSADPITDITVQKGKYEFDVDVTLSGQDVDEFELARGLAEKVLDRLP